MSKRLILTAGLIAALGVSACASERKPPRPGPAERAMRGAKSSIGKVFAGFDANRDTSVSQSELSTGIQEMFAAADTDHDKNISPLEFEALSRAKLGGNASPPYRLDFDRNVDSHITLTEFSTELQAIAKNLDEDKDGALSQTELSKAFGGPPDRDSAKDRRDDRRGSPGSEDGGPGAGMPPPR